jgi:hypothetical protein
VRIWVAAPGQVALDPFPFSHSGLELELSVRRIEARRYASAEEAAAAFHGADRQAVAVSLVAS